MSNPNIRDLGENAFSIQIPLSSGEKLELNSSNTPLVYVEDGFVLSYTNRGNGTPQSTAIFRGPTALGRFFTEDRSPYRLKALQDCTVTVLDRKSLDGSTSKFEEADQNDKFYLSLLVEALLQKNHSRKTSVIVGILDLITANGQFVTPELTGKDIGNLADARTPFVYRTLKGFISGGIIESPEPHRYQITQLGKDTIFYNTLPSLMAQPGEKYHPYQDYAQTTGDHYKLVKGLQADGREETLAWVLDLLTSGGNNPTPSLSLERIGLISGLNRSRVSEVLNLWIQKEFIYRTNGGNTYSYNLTESGKRALELIREGASSLRAYKQLTLDNNNLIV